MILPPEESTVESTHEPDTVEMRDVDEGAKDHSPKNPLGDPFQTTEPDIIDLTPSEVDGPSEDIRTETFRSPKPPMVPRREPPEGQGLSDVKTELFDPTATAESGLDQAPTMLIDPPSPYEETSSPQSSKPPWMVRSSPEESVREASTAREPGANDQTVASRLGLFVILAALFSLVGLGLLAYVLWGW
jgi:hypothetical protein